MLRSPVVRLHATVQAVFAVVHPRLSHSFAVHDAGECVQTPRTLTRLKQNLVRGPTRIKTPCLPTKLARTLPTTVRCAAAWLCTAVAARSVRLDARPVAGAASTFAPTVVVAPVSTTGNCVDHCGIFFANGRLPIPNGQQLGFVAQWARECREALLVFLDVFVMQPLQTPFPLYGILQTVQMITVFAGQRYNRHTDCVFTRSTTWPWQWLSADDACLVWVPATCGSGVFYSFLVFGAPPLPFWIATACVGCFPSVYTPVAKPFRHGLLIFKK
jgi:hypothetical protein